jgi:hypothetical protein
MPASVVGVREARLYMRGDWVVMDFKYSELFKAAVKDNVPDRRWEERLKEWTCPLASLPYAVALYSKAGYTVGKTLTTRASHVMQAPGFNSVKVCVSLDDAATGMVGGGGAGGGGAGGSGGASGGAGALPKVGHATLSFAFDRDLVTAIKEAIPPTQRRYNPDTKEWVVDLLALPHLIQMLRDPSGYASLIELDDVSADDMKERSEKLGFTVASDRLLALAAACEKLVEAVCPPSSSPPSSSSIAASSSSSSSPPTALAGIPPLSCLEEKEVKEEKTQGGASPRQPEKEEGKDGRVTVADANQMKVKELKATLASLDLPTDGLKAVLLTRLLVAIGRPDDDEDKCHICQGTETEVRKCVHG